jgi:hypothetical protein
LPEEARRFVHRPASGYILPRLLIEFIDVAGPDRSENIQTALEIFSEVVPLALDDIDLIVRYAEALAQHCHDNQNKAGVKKILQRLLDCDKVKEDNLYREYQRIADRCLSTRVLGGCYREEIDLVNQAFGPRRNRGGNTSQLCQCPTAEIV